MEIKILCNEQGCGKTTYALEKYVPNQYINFADKIESYSFDCIDESTYIILDGADSASCRDFSEIINALLNKKNVCIVIFDINQKNLLKNDNFNDLYFANLIPRNYRFEDFRLDLSCYYHFMQKYYPAIQKNDYKRIFEITHYNFNQIDRLMLINKLQGTSDLSIDNTVLSQYIDEYICNKFNNNPVLMEILKKSSLIGERFQSIILKSKDGFAYDNAVAYLNEIEHTQDFIKGNQTSELFQFISSDLYNIIYESIPYIYKTDWAELLINYYEKEYLIQNNAASKVDILYKIYQLASNLTDQAELSNKVLLHLFHQNSQLKTSQNVFEYAGDLKKTAHNNTMYYFVQSYHIKELMDNGEYAQAAAVLEALNSDSHFNGSRSYIEFYYASCLYNVGDVDQSYNIISNLSQKIKSTSGTNKNNQELYCKVYSLYATLQNHLGLDDGGLYYYRLALNQAKNNLRNERSYYEILKKCDMFFPYSYIKTYLTQCIDYFEKTGNASLAAEVYFNLATEMLFQDCLKPMEIKNYFEKCNTFFSSHHNEKYAYVQNNMGLYYILEENNIKRGMECFFNSLCTGLSDFTYMCIYLNICMSYVLLEKFDSEDFEQAYFRFNLLIKSLSKRKYATLYEANYKKLLDMILLEHKGKPILSDALEFQQSLDKESFFTPLVQDIIQRTEKSAAINHSENTFFYKRMSELKAFFAEFRFWE